MKVWLTRVRRSYRCHVPFLEHAVLVVSRRGIFASAEFHNQRFQVLLII